VTVRRSYRNQQNGRSVSGCSESSNHCARGGVFEDFLSLRACSGSPRPLGQPSESLDIIDSTGGITSGAVNRLPSREPTQRASFDSLDS